MQNSDDVGWWILLSCHVDKKEKGVVDVGAAKGTSLKFVSKWE